VLLTRTQVAEILGIRDDNVKSLTLAGYLVDRNPPTDAKPRTEPRYEEADVRAFARSEWPALRPPLGSKRFICPPPKQTALPLLADEQLKTPTVIDRLKTIEAKIDELLALWRV
jgi:hypothetical protein